MSEDIKVGVYGVIYYLTDVDKNVSPDLYDPVSYEQWKLLRELEPGKITNNYESYVELKREQYEGEVESRKNCNHILNTISYNLKDNQLEDTKRRLMIVQEDPLFNKWLAQDVVDYILNKERDEQRNNRP